jgi:hypothetical protein
MADFRDLLEAFARASVDVVLVGAYAVAYHARPRATKYIDLVLRGDPENLERAADALADFGAPRAVRTIDGVDAATLFANAIPTSIDGVPLRVISMDDLLANKTAVGRPQDLIDVELLERARASRQSSSM